MFRGPKVTLCILFAFALLGARAGEVIKTVVLDPGHGGKDPGCVYGTYKEKDITLDVAKRLGGLINDKYPSVKVVYTRSTDVFIELDQRGKIANKAGADLFLSIHVNATKSGAASGTETFIMGSTKGAANLEVAMRENDVIKFENDTDDRYQGYQAGSAESFIMFNLMQFAHREQSTLLAQTVQQQYKNSVRLPDRGVKEAGFLVLWRAAMPAILTEVGFINNQQDLKLLSTPDGRQQYARCLFNAFSAYKTRTEGEGSAITLVEEKQPETVSNPEPVRVRQPNPAADPVVAPMEKPAAQVSGTPVVTFAVQVRISPKSLSVNDPVFGEYRGKVFERKVGTTYKYYVGECASYREAGSKQAEVRRTVKDAFVVAFRDGTPIPVADALKLIKN